MFAQFVIFLVAFIFLKYFIFSPYLRAYEERRKRTVGSAGVAKELQEQIALLESDFSQKAKALNEQIKGVFEEKRQKAGKETANVISLAQKTAQEKMAVGKKEVQQAYDEAKDQLKKLAPDLGQTIKQRLLEP
ncbi:ATP synthase F0 subunit B [bacterium]|nr:ATP synthase F0 subunit B [bacterium]